MTAGGPPKYLYIDGHQYTYTAECDVGRQLGGVTNEHKSNGDKSIRKIQTPVPWKLTGNIVQIDDAQGDHERLAAAQASADDLAITIEYASGISYSGVGGIEGELSFSNNDASASFDLAGPDSLERD